MPLVRIVLLRRCASRLVVLLSSRTGRPSSRRYSRPRAIVLAAPAAVSSYGPTFP
jgi:hypothetical protein